MIVQGVGFLQLKSTSVHGRLRAADWYNVADFVTY